MQGYGNKVLKLLMIVLQSECIIFVCFYLQIPTTLFTPLEYGVVGASEDESIQKYDEDSIEVNLQSFNKYEQ